MISLIRKSLELKILLALFVVMAGTFSLSAFLDIRDMKKDTIRTSERTLGAFASAIKGSVNAAMKKGHHEDVRNILNEVNTPFFIDRLVIYNEVGRPLMGTEKMNSDSKLDMNIAPDMLRSVVSGDVSEVRSLGDNHFISYFSPIANQPECYRCHGSASRLNGILRVDFSLRELDDLIAMRRNRVLVWSAALFVLLTAVLAAVLRVVVYRPVKQLHEAMMQVREGTEAPVLVPKGSDELSDLMKSFVDMIGQIKLLHRNAVDKEKELTRSREALRYRTELEAMFDAMPDGVLLVGPDMNIIHANPKAFAILPGLRMGHGRIRLESDSAESCPYEGVRLAFDQLQIQERLCSYAAPEGPKRHIHSICAPIMENGSAVSVVEVLRDITERVNTERELAEKRTELLAMNKKLSALAHTDGLTQVYNRHRFDEILNKELKRFSRRKYSSLSLMMIDIDHFKKLNDRYGHLAGDAVLREMARLLKESVRETDTVARFGGEEFVIILPDTTLEGAVYKAEFLRKRTEQFEFPGQDAPLRITISIGVAGYASGSPQELIHAADLALYEAKHSGRNFVAAGKAESLLPRAEQSILQQERGEER